MFWRKFFRKKDHRSYKKVYERPEFVPQDKAPSLSISDKNAVKSHLLHEIKNVKEEERLPFGLERLSFDIKQATQDVKIPLPKRIVLKNRLLEMIDQASVLDAAFGSPKPFWQGKGFVSALLFVFVFTFALSYPLKVPETYASTYLEDVSGSVTIIRNGQIYKAQKDFILHEGDILLTGKGSLATVHFVNEATGRLGESGKLSLKRLENDVSEINKSSKFEVYLEEGKLWTRVFEGDQKDSTIEFVVLAKDTQAVAKEKAAFNVHVLPDKEIVTVFDNKVDVAVKNDLVTAQITQKKETVSAGFQAEISKNDGNDVQPKVQPLESLSEENEKEQSWYAANLDQDKKKEQKIDSSKIAHNENNKIEGNKAKEIKKPNSAANEEKGSKQETPNNQVPNQSDAVIDETVIVARIKEMKDNFLQVQQDFAEGENLLLANQGQEGMKNILLFEKTVRSYLNELKDFESKNLLEVAEFKTFMKSEVNAMAEKLVAFLPGDPLFPAKESIEDMEILFADSPLGETTIFFAQAKNQLRQLEELLNSTRVEKAQELFIRYERKFQHIYENLDVLSSNAEYSSVLLQELFVHLENLTEYEGVLAQVIDTKKQEQVAKEFLAQLREERSNILQYFVSGFSYISDYSAQRILANVKSFYENYFAAAYVDPAFMASVKDLLQKKGYLEAASTIEEKNTLPSNEQKSVEVIPTQQNLSTQSIMPDQQEQTESSMETETVQSESSAPGQPVGAQ